MGRMPREEWQFKSFGLVQCTHWVMLRLWEQLWLLLDYYYLGTLALRYCTCKQSWHLQCKICPQRLWASDTRRNHSYLDLANYIHLVKTCIQFYTVPRLGMLICDLQRRIRGKRKWSKMAVSEIASTKAYCMRDVKSKVDAAGLGVGFVASQESLAQAGS